MNQLKLVVTKLQFSYLGGPHCSRMTTKVNQMHAYIKARIYILSRISNIYNYYYHYFSILILESFVWCKNTFSRTLCQEYWPIAQHLIFALTSLSIYQDTYTESEVSTFTLMNQRQGDYICEPDGKMQAVRPGEPAGGDRSSQEVNPLTINPPLLSKTVQHM